MKRKKKNPEKDLYICVFCPVSPEEDTCEYAGKRKVRYGLTVFECKNDLFYTSRCGNCTIKRKKLYCSVIKQECVFVYENMFHEKMLHVSCEQCLFWKKPEQFIPYVVMGMKNFHQQ